MNDLIRAALVIARRDYVASVWSKTFLLFLLGPLLPIVAGTFFGTVGSNIDRKATHPTVAILAAPAQGAALMQAHDRLAARVGQQALPDLRIVTPAADPDAQTRRLLADQGEGIVAVMRGGLDRPLLLGPRVAIADNRDDLALIYDDARMARQIATSGAKLPPPIEIATRVADKAAGTDVSARVMTARLAQILLMLLTMILSGMLLSNLVEEKSNKVIEVLAAAVPVDAIFIGKLVAMLGMSLTGIAVWGTSAVLVVTILFPGAASALPPPAVGWPAFVALGVIYFIACYMLLGALFLGIGAQASSVREVQTLSMPATMGQMAMVGLSSSAVGDPGGTIGIIAMIFPWSSPFAMIARAAQLPELAPHLIAIVWQGLWIALIIRFTARRFRVSVLKSGGRRSTHRAFFWRKRAPA